MAKCELLVVGHVSKDINISCDGTEQRVGGAVVFSSIALRHLGAQVHALTKVAEADTAALDIFREHGVPLTSCPSANTTSIRNTYHTPDRERRTCEAIGQADPFCAADVPEEIEPAIYYLGGLMGGEFPKSFVEELSRRGPVAVDMQGFLRVNECGAMVYRDWAAKRELLPLIDYVKVDAAEAEVLTGEKDILRAARQIITWGAREVVLTHTGGVLACTEDQRADAPFTARNLSGRTGRGDTCFASYCWRRLSREIADACPFAAAVTSLKMERPGPFQGTVADVEAALHERYGR